MKPREIARAIRRLRGTTLLLFDSLDDREFDVEVLPGWSAADVFAHLASSDRGAVRGSGLRDLLPTRSVADLEAANDVNLERLRDVDRLQLRRELEVWGRRLAGMISTVPNVMGKLRIRSIFGATPLSLLGGLRLQDEWVHNYDLAMALDRDVPSMDGALSHLLAEANLMAAGAGPLKQVQGVDGVVEITVGDLTPRRFDLASRRSGPRVTSSPSARVHMDTPTMCLVAAHRWDWREQVEAGRVQIDDDAQGSAAALLDQLYFV